MNVSTPVLGLLRGLASCVVWALATAVLSYFSDATHLSGVLNEGLAALIAGLASMLEHKLEEKNGTALFGAVRRA